METKQINIAIPIELHNRIALMSARNGTTKKQTITDILIKYFKDDKLLMEQLGVKR